MVHAYMTCKYVFNLCEGDVVWSLGDCGWVTGHVCACYGPQLNGATAVIYEGIPSYPDYGRVWQVCDLLLLLLWWGCCVIRREYSIG